MADSTAALARAGDEAEWKSPERWKPPELGELHHEMWHPMYQLLVDFLKPILPQLELVRLIFIYGVSSLVVGEDEQLNTIGVLEVGPVLRSFAIRVLHGQYVVGLKGRSRVQLITFDEYEPMSTREMPVANPFGNRPPPAYSDQTGCMYSAIPTKHAIQIYSVVDSKSKVDQKERKAGTLSRFGQFGGLEYRFDTPLGVAASDETDCLFICDAGNKRIACLGYEHKSNGGRSWVEFGSKELEHPVALHILPETSDNPLTCYVVEDKSVRIYHYERPTIISLSKKWGARYHIRHPDFDQLTSVVVTDRYIVIADAGSGWIYVFNRERVFLKRFGTERTVSTDPWKRLYHVPETLVYTGGHTPFAGKSEDRPQIVVGDGVDDLSQHLFTHSDLSVICSMPDVRSH